MSVSECYVTSAFATFCEVANGRAEQLQESELQDLVSSSENEMGSKNPVYDSIYSSIETGCIRKMCNVTPEELFEIFHELQPQINQL